jgi:preprotein translocase YajC subunit
MFWNLLAEEGGNSSSLILMGVLLLVVVAFMVINRRSQKKKQEETVSMLNAIKPGNKVKTIGGICGVVVEVCDDNTFVLETGTQKSGKSYIKFDKQAVYQTDAVVDKTPAKPVEKVEEVKEEAKEEVQEVAEEKSEN